MIRFKYTDNTNREIYDIKQVIYISVELWTHLCVEIVFYSDNDLSVNVKDFKLTLDLSYFHKYYQNFYDANM